MSVLFYILGGIVLIYWGYCMNLPLEARPVLILKNGGMVLVVSIALFMIGFVV